MADRYIKNSKKIKLVYLKTFFVYSIVCIIIDLITVNPYSYSYRYSDVCYYDFNAYLLNKLVRLLNNCIRFVFNFRKYDHVSRLRLELNW